MEPTAPPPEQPYPPGPGLASPSRTARMPAIRLGDALAVGGSVVVFAFSFAPFVKLSGTALLSALTSAGLATSHNAWATETFMAPLTWFVIFAALLVIAFVLLRYPRASNPQVLGFRLTQVELGLALFTLVVLFGMVTSEKHVIFGAGARAFGEGGAGLHLGWGATVMLIGALIATTGAVLNHLSIGLVLFPRPVSRAAMASQWPALGQPVPTYQPEPTYQPVPPSYPGQPVPIYQPAPAGQPAPPSQPPAPDQPAPPSQPPAAGHPDQPAPPGQPEKPASPSEAAAPNQPVPPATDT
jgi:hypothetical protein